MNRLDSPQPERSQLQRKLSAAWLAIAASLVLHGLLFLLLGLGSMPRTTLPFVLPLELEIGLGESEDKDLGGAAEVEGRRGEVANQQGRDAVTKVVAKPPQRAPEAASAVPDPSQEPRPTTDAVSMTDAGVASADVEAGDAAVTDAGLPQLAGSGTADAGPVGPRRGIGGGAGSGFGNGALLALRIDVANVRKSALILETESLLSLVPGWQRLFAGSGIVPLSHFKRFVIATPNLHPSRLSMAAILRDGIRGVESLKERAAQGGPLRELDGLAVGTWSTRGTTVRDVVFLNERTFAVSRAQDLPRVLALGRVLGAQIEDAVVDPDPLMAGLLHMGPTEALSLTVHHVSAFVPNAVDTLPTRLRFLLDQPTQSAVQLHVIGDYESSEQAEQALSRWQKTYEDIAARPEVASFGLAGAIEHARFERVEHEVHARTQVTMAQLRYLLSQLRIMLEGLVPASAE